MHTLSSAKRTCIASASAVECTATRWMPSSLQARSTRRAISPRLAIRILSNMDCPHAEEHSAGASGTRRRVCASLNDHQRLAELDRLAVFEQNLNHGSAAGGRNLVHGLHRFHNQERVAGLNLSADIDDRLSAGLASRLGCSDR